MTTPGMKTPGMKTPGMKTVEVRLIKDASVGNGLADICDWLSREHCEPGMSSCAAVGDWVVVQVVFSVSRDGDAFAKRFDGRVISPEDEERFS